MADKARIYAVLFVAVLLMLGSKAESAPGFTLTINVAGSGSVSRNPTNTSYPSGSTVTLTAISNDPSWYFSNWSGNSNSTANPFNITMDANKVITATFQQFPSYMLTLVTNGQGTISLSPAGGVYVSNTVVTATATPAAGWVFASWSGSTNGNANPLSITMNSNNSLTGTFAQVPAFDVLPQSITNSTGSTVTFSSHAVGDSPLSYQWLFNNAVRSGATNNSLSLTNVQLADAGNYKIVVTNNYGSATSSVVSLVLTNLSGSTNIVSTPTEASLRSAIQIGGWVSINCNGTFTLTNTINITNNVILDAQNVSAVISGGNAVRLFTVALGATLSMTNLVLANGSCIVTNGTAGTPADAGAIYNNGTVTLVSCTVTNNNAQSLIYGGLARGGAIFNDGGTASLFQTAISNNAAIGGGPFSPSTTVFGTALGGAIYNTNGSVTITSCNVSSNVCNNVCENNGFSGPTGLTMGGAAFQASGSLTVASSIFSSNLALGGNGVGAPATPSSPAYGGTLAANGGSITIFQSQFFANTARGGDAGFHGKSGSAFGGAIYSASMLTVKDSSFFVNQSFTGNGTAVPTYSKGMDGYGGAIYNSGTASLNRCSLYSNYVQGGSAVLSVPFGSANGGNGFGGAIFNASQFGATNSTIALNSASGGNGDGIGSTVGISGNAVGGGLFNNSNAMFIAMNLTIASNSCSSPSGSNFTNGITAGTQIANTNGTLRLHNSIIAYGGSAGNSFGVITDDGFNISDDDTANLSGGASYNFTDPKIGPLNSYAATFGSTYCMAPSSDSPAIDFGDSSGAPNTDQRGYPRPAGDGVDIGAFEFYAPNQIAIPQMSLGSAANSTPNGLALNFTAFPTNSYRLQASTNLVLWVDLETNGPFASPTNINRTISIQGSDHRFFRLLLQ